MSSEFDVVIKAYSNPYLRFRIDNQIAGIPSKKQKMPLLALGGKT